MALADVNPAAVAAMRETVRRNGLDDRVSVYLSDGLGAMPEEERWDLVSRRQAVGPATREALVATESPGTRRHRPSHVLIVALADRFGMPPECGEPAPASRRSAVRVSGPNSTTPSSPSPAASPVSFRHGRSP
jgi:hypothetical protein